MARNRILALVTLLLALLAATWQRARAVEKLPPDFDEAIYLPVAVPLRAGGLLAAAAYGRPSAAEPGLISSPCQPGSGSPHLSPGAWRVWGWMPFR
ncbi:hypothetical protein ACN28E_38460 [Archangium lansingense]|uniref:hypothetical protein n=1 Tax=Archangium lansingense TaxID=2995310 RepID=UPI003B804E98